MAAAGTTTVPPPQETIIGTQIPLPENTPSQLPSGNGTLGSAPSTSVTSQAEKISKNPKLVNQSILNKVVRDKVTDMYFNGQESSIDGFFENLKKHGYSDDQILKSQEANTDLNKGKIFPLVKTPEVIKQQAEKKAKESSYLGGALTAFNEGFNNSIMTPLDGAAKLVSDLTGLEHSGAFKTAGDNIVNATKEDNAFGSSNMPEGATGDILKGVSSTLPMLATLGLTPEVKIAQGLAIPKLSTQMAATGFLNQYSATGNALESTKAGLLGAGEGAIMHGLGLSAEGIGNIVKELGAGALTSKATAVAANGLLFGGYEGAKEYAMTGKIDTDKMLANMGVGIALSVPGLVGETKKAITDTEIASALTNKIKDNALINYFSTPNEDINKINQTGQSVEELRNKAQKIGEELLTPDEISFVSKPSDQSGNIFVKVDNKSKEELPITEQEYNDGLKSQDDKKQSLVIAQNSLNAMADAMAINNAAANHPQEYVDAINADDSLTPEQKQEQVDKVTNSAQTDAAVTAVQRAEQQHIENKSALETNESGVIKNPTDYYHLAEKAVKDESILPSVKQSLDAMVEAKEITTQESAKRYSDFEGRVKLQEKINPKITDHEDRMKAIDLQELLNKQEARLKEMKGWVPPAPENAIKVKEGGIEETKYKLNDLFTNAVEKTKVEKEKEQVSKDKLRLSTLQEKAKTEALTDDENKELASLTESLKPLSAEPKENLKLTHKAIDAARQALGLNYADKAPSDILADFEEAKDRYTKDPKEAQRIIDDYLGGRKGSTRVEAYIVDIHIKRLAHDMEVISDKIFDLKRNKESSQEDIDNAYTEQQTNLMNQDIATRISKAISSEAAKVLQSRQGEITHDLTLEQTIALAKSYSKDGTLTPEQEAYYKGLQDKLDEANKTIEELKKNQSKDSATQTFNDIKNEDKAPRKTTIVNRTKAERLAKIEELKKKIAIEGLDIGGNVKQGLFPSFSNAKLRLIAELGAERIAMGITDFGKWSKLLKKDVDGLEDEHLKHIWENESVEGKKLKDFALEIEKGKDIKLNIDDAGKISGMRVLLKHLIDTGTDNIDDAISEIQERHPDLTKREITDAISGYGKTRKLTTDPYELKLQELTSISGMLSQLDDLENGILPKAFKESRPKSEMERELREQINNLKREKQGELQDQVSPEHLRTLRDAWERRIQNNIDKLNKKIKEGNIQKEVKKQLEVDARMLELMRERAKIKNKIKTQLENERLANRSGAQKVIDVVIKSWRAYLLSNIVGGVTKLVGGATIGASLITRPLDAIMFSVLSAKLSPLRKISEQSPMFSGNQIGPYVRSLAKMFSKDTGRDIVQLSKDIFNIGRNAIPKKISEKFGYEQKDIVAKTSEEIIWGDSDNPQPKLLDVINVFHKLLKTPLKKSKFSEAFEKNLEWEAKQKDSQGNPVDIKDPVVIYRSAIRSLAESDRALFLNDNLITTGYKQFLGTLKRSDNPIAHGTAAALDFEIPMVKVAVNYALELAQRTHGLGLVEGGIHTIALYDKLDQLTPEQANSIMRAFGRGAVGLVLYKLGYYFYHNAGGGYVRSQKNDKEDEGLKPGDFIINGFKVPHGLLHGTGANTFELGAQQAWSEQEYKDKDSDAPWIDASLDVEMIVLEENPIVKGAGKMGESVKAGRGVVNKLLNPKEKEPE